MAFSAVVVLEPRTLVPNVIRARCRNSAKINHGHPFVLYRTRPLFSKWPLVFLPVSSND